MYNIYKARKKMIRDSKKRQEIWRVFYFTVCEVYWGASLINTCYYSIQFTRTYIYIYYLWVFLYLGIDFEVG